MEPIVLAGRIKELREAKGYTINKLASQAGISQIFLRDIELGNKKPTVDTLDAICWALDISLSDFLMWNGIFFPKRSAFKFTA